MDQDPLPGLLDEYAALSAEGRWPAVEQRGREVAVALAGEAVAEAIASVDLARYADEVVDIAAWSLEIASREALPAVYLEYDIDDQWTTTSFVCQDYRPASATDDEWRRDWVLDSATVDAPELADHFTGFDETPECVGRTAFLIARTTAAVGAACEGLRRPGLPLCLGYPDQAMVFRLPTAED